MINSKEQPDETQCLENTTNKMETNEDVLHNSANSQTKICSYFSNYGYCKFGKSCRYIHTRKQAENKNSFRQHNLQQSIIPQKLLENKEFNPRNTVSSHVLKKPNRQTSRQICRYYKAGNCSKDDCDFLHTDSLYDGDNNTRISSNQSRNASRKFYSSYNRMTKKKSTPFCYYFKRGLCMKGDSCKYFHPNNSTDPKCKNSTNIPIETGNDDNELCHEVQNILLDSSDSCYEVQNILPDSTNPCHEVQNILSDSINSFHEIQNFPASADLYHNGQNILPDGIDECEKTTAITCSEKTADIYNLYRNKDISLLRNTEINQMKKRFPNHEAIVENETFSFIFQPSDPDWPFDVRKLKIEVNFPENYPSEKCKLTVHQDNEFIPELLKIHLNKAISEWIENRYEENKASNKTELIFRPFLRWFDKNLESLFIAGLRKVKMDLKAKEAGIEFVPSECLFTSPRIYTSSESSEDSVNRDSLYPDHENQILTPVSNLNTLSNQSSKLPYYSSDQGTKLIFSNLELIEGAAALICTKISVTLQCSRCKTSFTMKAVPKKNISHTCSKCSKNLGFTFDPSTIHQFSSVVGNLHLLDCVAVDVNLVECHFLVDCLSCSKQVPVDGIHYGQKHKMWCTFCHDKMLISIGSVKCQALKLPSVPATKYLPVKKIDKKIKDPIVKEGEPLPNFGACKHYKKSFRWLRFPCCGRLYPCDECHDEKETDHEMKYASRMICGFCAKEQPYSREKPCLLCSQDLTKKSGSHWEGGKGCRNKITMSRDDKHKYAGASKTASKKAQNTKPKKKH